MKPNLEAFNAAVEDAGINPLAIANKYSLLPQTAELYAASRFMEGDSFLPNDEGFELELPVLTVCAISADTRANIATAREFIADMDFGVRAVDIEPERYAFENTYFEARLISPAIKVDDRSEYLVTYAETFAEEFRMSLNHPVDHEWGQVFDVLLSDQVDEAMIQSLLVAALSRHGLTNQYEVGP